MSDLTGEGAETGTEAAGGTEIESGAGTELTLVEEATLILLNRGVRCKLSGPKSALERSLDEFFGCHILRAGEGRASCRERINLAMVMG